jgi:hypothetical protein
VRLEEGGLEDIPTLGGSHWVLFFVWSVFPVSGTRISSGALLCGVACVWCWPSLSFRIPACLSAR